MLEEVQHELGNELVHPLLPRLLQRARIDRFEQELPQPVHCLSDVRRLSDLAALVAGIYQVVDQRVDAVAPRLSKQAHRLRRPTGGAKEPGPHGVVDVVVDVGDAVRKTYDPSLQCGRELSAGVPANAVAHLPGEVQTAAVVFQELDHAYALLVVLESAL